MKNILKYRTELGITSSGVPIHLRSTGVKKYPHTVRIMPIIAAKAKSVWAATETPSMSFAPYFLPIMTDPPIKRPIINPTIRKIKLPVVLTAASASLPKTLPTTTESTTL